jgi:hypothetical protein
MGSVATIRHLALAALVATTALAQAGSVRIDDQANLLGSGRSQIESAALSSPFQIQVLTRSNSRSKAELDEIIDDIARGGRDGTLAMGVDSTLRHLHIAANNAYVDRAAVDDAQRLAGTHFKNQDWAAGFAAAIQQLSSVAMASRSGGTDRTQTAGVPATTGGGTRPTSPGGGGRGGLPWGLILLGIAAFFLFRMFRRRRTATAYGPEDARYQNVPYDRGQDMRPGYDPRYTEPQRRSGLGGLLGGLGGGMLGYHLGRRKGQSEKGGLGSPGGTSRGTTPRSDPGGFVSGSSDAGDFGGGSRGKGSGSSNSGDF